MSGDYQRLLGMVTNLQRMMGNMFRPGTVKKVDGDRLRAVLGKDSEGKDVLGPWLDHANHRGGARERHFFKENQNVMFLCPNGDPLQAMMLPYAPNKDHKPPDHANTSGQDEETWQLDDMRMKRTKNGYSLWMQDPQQQQQQGQEQQSSGGSGGGGSSGGGGGDQEQAPQRQPQKPDGKVTMRIHKDGFTARLGKDKFVQVHGKGVKIKQGSNAIFVDDGGCWSTKPIEVKDDPIPDDKDTDV